LILLGNSFYSAGQTLLTKCPHHYMLVFRTDVSSIVKIADNPDFEGMQIKLDWKTIEPEKDRFDFALVDSILDVADSYGKKIVFQFQYKAFNGAPPVVPDYLITDPYYEGGVSFYPDSSSTLKLWIPAVTARLDSVFSAMGSHFGDHPALEGINLPESATNSAEYDYDVNEYMKGIMANIENLRNAFPDSVFVVQYLNWLPGSGPRDSLIANLRTIAEFTTQFENTGFGGPDNKIQTDPNPTYTPVMTFQYEFDGRAVLANATQWNDYGYINPYTGEIVTAEEILRYSVDSLKDNYIFWLEREPYFSDEVVPTLEQYRGRCTDSLSYVNVITDAGLIDIFPNPSQDMVNLKTGDTGNFMSVKLYSAAGMYINTYFSDRFPVAGLPRGPYLLIIQTDKGQYAGKFVKE